MESYLVQHSMQLIPCLNNSVPVVAINHKDKTLGVLEVVPPQWANLQTKQTINRPKEGGRKKS